MKIVLQNDPFQGDVACFYTIKHFTIIFNCFLNVMDKVKSGT